MLLSFDCFSPFHTSRSRFPMFFPINSTLICIGSLVSRDASFSFNDDHLPATIFFLPSTQQKTIEISSLPPEKGLRHTHGPTREKPLGTEVNLNFLEEDKSKSVRNPRTQEAGPKKVHYSRFFPNSSWVAHLP